MEIRKQWVFIERGLSGAIFILLRDQSSINSEYKNKTSFSPSQLHHFNHPIINKSIDLGYQQQVD